MGASTSSDWFGDPYENSDGVGERVLTSDWLGDVNKERYKSTDYGHASLIKSLVVNLSFYTVLIMSQRSSSRQPLSNKRYKGEDYLSGTPASEMTSSEDEDNTQPPSSSLRTSSGKASMLLQNRIRAINSSCLINNEADTSPTVQKIAPSLDSDELPSTKIADRSTEFREITTMIERMETTLIQHDSYMAEYVAVTRDLVENTVKAFKEASRSTTNLLLKIKTPEMQEAAMHNQIELPGGFPLNTLDEFEEFETANDDSKFNLLVEFIASRGGNTINRAINIIMTETMTSALAVLMTWSQGSTHRVEKTKYIAACHAAINIRAAKNKMIDLNTTADIQRIKTAVQAALHSIKEKARRSSEKNRKV